MHFFRPRSKSPVAQPVVKASSSSKGSEKRSSLPIASGDLPPSHPSSTHHYHHSHSNSIGSTSSVNGSQNKVHLPLQSTEVGQRRDGMEPSVTQLHNMIPANAPPAPGRESNSKKHEHGRDHRSAQGGGALPLPARSRSRGGKVSSSRSPAPLSPGVGAGAGRRHSASPTTAGPSSTSAPSPSRYLIKGVESHVFLTFLPKSFVITPPSTSSPYTSIRWERNPPKGEEEGEEEKIAGKHHGGSSQSGGESSGGHSSSSPNFKVTRAHAHPNPKTFYDEVIAPCVANSLAGQSYIFLVNGPVESGRSATIYGSNHGTMKGIVELTADDLLRRAAKRKEAALAVAGSIESGERDGGQAAARKATPSPMRSTAPHASGGVGGGSAVGDASASLSGLTVTYSAFTTRGKEMTETAPTPMLVASTDPATQMEETNRKDHKNGLGDGMHTPGSPRCETAPTAPGAADALLSTNAASASVLQMVPGRPVPLVPFPPPLGAFPLAYMQLLESGASSVVVPEKRRSEASCMIQFQVYAPVDTHGTTRSFATLTFIDVAPFTVPLSSEVAHLVTTIRRVAGMDATSPPDFKGTALTSLLEPALTGGSVTLMNITTISGRSDLFEPAQVALHFASSMTRIQQVLLLTHLRPPRWLFEAGQSLEARIRRLREEVEATQYEKGVQDYYETVQKWLNKNVNEEAEVLAAELSRETEMAREHVASEASRWIADLQQEMNQWTEKSQAEVKLLKTIEDQYGHEVSQLEIVKHRLNTVKEDAHAVEFSAARRLSETRLAITQLEGSDGLQKQEWNQCQKSLLLFQTKINDLNQMLRRYAEDLQGACVSYRYAKEFSTYKHRREALEEELVAVSKLASQRHENWKIKRERRSKIARLEVLEKRVQTLRAQLPGAEKLF